jgi:hypothetical protein
MPLFRKTGYKDDEYGPGYKQTRMYIQFGNIEDSQDNPHPLDTVKTDDGEIVKVTLEQATKMKALEMAFKKPMDRIKFADEIQYSEGLNKWLNSAVLSLVSTTTKFEDNSIYS